MIGLLPGRGGADLTLQDARGMITLLLTLERNQIVTVESTPEGLLAASSDSKKIGERLKQGPLIWS